MRKYFIAFGLLIVLGIAVISCNNTTSPKTYQGQFGDQYVFIEIRGTFQTQGGTQNVNFQGYSFDQNSGKLTLYSPVLDPYDNFALIYGLAMDFHGSMNGTMSLAGDVNSFPQTYNLADLVQASIPLNMSITFNSVSDSGDVNFSLSVSDPNSGLSADTTAVLEAGHSYQTGLLPPFTMVFQGDSIYVEASAYQASNYGFQQKQDISINLGQSNNMQ